MKFLLAAICLLLIHPVLQAQTCTAPGQNPGTAFPVCGTSTFTQTSVPICGGRQVPNPACTSVPLTDVNPFWYKFTCFQAGTLGFTIKPHTNSEDYDWQVFDITGQNPDAVYTNPALVVGSNWSGEGGQTGASSAGSSLMVCDGLGRPLWSKMPQLIQGHEYLLLVSHFTQTQSGYDLSFGGGTAVITDPTPPHLKFADAACGGDIVRVKLNKKMKCGSIAANGSDFVIVPGNVPITSAVAIGCSGGFDTDSVELHLGALLAPGTYNLSVKQGTDNNTILDNCGNAIPETDQVSFTVYPLIPTPMDSLVPVKCKPQSLQLIFRKPMLCSSIAANGSDFSITGPYPVTITGASGNCAAGTTGSRVITIHLSAPLYQGGNFTLTLKTGTDGNTILDECSKETPAGSILTFTLKDTVNAGFSYQKRYGCSEDTILFFHPAANGVNNWDWHLDDNQTSTLQNPQGLYGVFNTKNIQLAVSNGFCSDTSSQSIVLDNFIKADFISFEDNCPNETVNFTGTPTGNVKQHNWTFGDGGSASVQSPAHLFPAPLTTTPFIVRYTVTDSIGCQSTAQKTIKIYSSCYLAVPTAFTPNNDGKNDYLYPLNAIKAEQLDFKVFNRWGQLVFQTKNWKQGWDGTVRGIPQGASVYVWYLSYTDRDTKERRQMKGTAALVR